MSEDCHFNWILIGRQDAQNDVPVAGIEPGLLFYRKNINQTEFMNLAFKSNVIINYDNNTVIHSNL